MPADSPEERSKVLAKVRHELRRHLDNCEKMTDQSSYEISLDTPIAITPSEEKAIVRHIDASHGDRFIVDMAFVRLRKSKNRPSVSRIEMHVIRRRKRRQYVRL